MPILRGRDEVRTVQLRFRVPHELATRLAEVRQAAEDAGFELPVDEMIARALQRVVAQAQRELTEAASRAGPTGSGPSSPSGELPPDPAS